MKKIHLAAISLLFLAIRQCCFGVEDTNVLALGAWSEPVSNEYGHKLRGRFAMCAYPNHRGPANRLDVGVYVDLQEYSDSIGGDLEVYCDFTKGLKCELCDALGRPPEPVGFGYDGGAPGVGWLSLPPFSTVRLRATVFAGGRLRDSSLGIWFTGAGAWTIKPSDTNTYFLSGTLMVSPPPVTNSVNHTLLWTGTLKLPKMKIWAGQP